MLSVFAGLAGVMAWLAWPTVWSYVLGACCVGSMLMLAARERPRDAPAAPADADGTEWHRHGILAVRAELQIEYRTAEGDVIERRVDVHFYDYEAGTIEAHCHLRDERRTFRLDRIRSAIDLETGEVLPVKRLRSWLRTKRTRR